jgi:hypothetical protein
MAGADGLAISCPRCGSELPDSAREPAGASCSVCGTHAHVVVFPAMFRRAEPVAGQIVLAGEAACYFHAERVAVVPCGRCGRFLCQFCRISWAGEDLCPACIAASRRGDKTAACYRYDSLALAVSTLPVLTVFLTLITAPLALGIALFTFRKECSVAPRTKVRFVAAIAISLAQISAWIVFFVYAFRQRMGG